LHTLNGKTKRRNVFGMTKKIRIKLSRKRLRSDWGAYFIVSFIIILSIAIAFYISNSTQIAESIANYAYYALVIGVVLKIVGFARTRRKERSFAPNTAI
jgi:hypothetical protein